MTSDWRGVARTRRSGNEKNAKQSKSEDSKIGNNGKTIKYDDLLVENWVQCDKCNKWRLLKAENGKFQTFLK